VPCSIVGQSSRAPRDPRLAAIVLPSAADSRIAPRTSASRQKLPLHERSFRESACANTYLAILRGAVRKLSQGCIAHARAELRIRQRLRLFGFGSQSRLFPSVLTRATKDRARSQEIVGRRARSSNLVAGERYNAKPTIAEALFSYRRAPVTRA